MENFDINKDGKLSQDESQMFLRKYLEEDKFGQEEIAQAFKQIDQGGKGFIDK